jgi:hypothetical protein
MTGNAINAKSEALELHELSSEDLDAVSGGWFGISLSGVSLRQQENQEQLRAAETFKNCLQRAGQV